MRAMAATTVRLPELLKLEAETYAQRLGISVNALLSVALRDYLDSRKGGPPVAQPAASAAVSVGQGPTRQRAAKAPRLSGKERRAPCPCGSGKEYRHCHERISAAHPAS